MNLLHWSSLKKSSISRSEHTDILLKRSSRCRTIWSMAEYKCARHGQRGKRHEYGKNSLSYYIVVQRCGRLRQRGSRVKLESAHNVYIEYTGRLTSPSFIYMDLLNNFFFGDNVEGRSFVICRKFSIFNNKYLFSHNFETKNLIKSI